MERNWHIPTDKKAFTLVELVIVIVIVGILSTISVSAYSSLSLKAIEAEGASLLSFIIKNEVTHQIENGSFLGILQKTDKSDELGVDLNISKYFQTFQAMLSVDDQGNEFVLVVLNGTYKGQTLTMSLGRYSLGSSTGILKGQEATDIAKAMRIASNSGKDNGGNGNYDKTDNPNDDKSQGQGTGNGNGNGNNG
ncbi:MAG: prepilin-type N-terminal cleavage/methylation domain-containing protein [Endomicrobiaceae bacterium]|nr:prepilin-type N-terminal cleavage/methylation domain-containing protein [Endomicrobiaceae bacterium]